MEVWPLTGYLPCYLLTVCSNFAGAALSNILLECLANCVCAISVRFANDQRYLLYLLHIAHAFPFNAAFTEIENIHIRL